MIDTDAFEAQRPRLIRLAYRMLGSVAEAEDAVQDAWLRWTRAGEDVADPAAWLVRVTSRLCIDRMRAAKTRRDAYRGPWLPEPLIEELSVDPVERAEDVSVAFLLALERLSPLERAVFLLHDVFDEDYAQVAETLGKTEPAVRQLAARARAHVKDNRPRFTVSQEEAAKLAAAFMAAAAQGDMAALSAVLDGMGLPAADPRRATLLGIDVSLAFLGGDYLRARRLAGALADAARGAPTDARSLAMRVLAEERAEALDLAPNHYYTNYIHGFDGCVGAG